MKITAMIPARIGSQRLKMKNLALLNGKPMIYYAIKAAQDSGVFDNIIINTDHEIFKEVAESYGVDFYLRPVELGSSEAKMDDVNMDFIEKNPCDVMAIVNTPSPLQTGKEVAEGVRFFLDNNYDSMIAVREYFVHATYDEKPLNFDLNEQLQRTQDLMPVNLLIYSIMAWKCSSFVKEYQEKGRAFFCGKTGFFKASKESALLVKNEEDLLLIDRIMRANDEAIEYDDLVKSVL